MQNMTLKNTQQGFKRNSQNHAIYFTGRKQALKKTPEMMKEWSPMVGK